MTFNRKQGYENVLESLKYYLAENLPGAITQLNSEERLMIESYRSGPFTIPAGSTLNFTIQDTTGTYTYAISLTAGSRTATQVSAEINAETYADGFGCIVSNEQRIRIMKQDEGAGYIRLSPSTPSTLNAVFGWLNDRHYESYLPLPSLKYIGTGFENIPVSAIGPSISIWCTGDSQPYSDFREYQYSVILRIDSVFEGYWGNLYQQLSRYALLIRNLINSDGQPLWTQVNDARIVATRPDVSISIPVSEEPKNPKHVQAAVELDLTVAVQEDPEYTYTPVLPTL